MTVVPQEQHKLSLYSVRNRRAIPSIAIDNGGGKSLVPADKLCIKLRVKPKAESYSPEGQNIQRA